MKIFSKIMLVKERTAFCGPGPIALLKLIRENKSIKEAAREMGMSYSKALKLIDNLEEGFGLILVERYRGGSLGGESYITEEGKKIIDSYDQLVSKCDQFVKKEFEKTFDWIK